MAVIGMEAEAARAREARDAPFAVHRCNWLTVRLWADLWPRWRMVATMTGMRRQCLDLDQVVAAMDLTGVARKDRREIYEGLLVMEEEAIKALRESE